MPFVALMALTIPLSNARRRFQPDSYVLERAVLFQNRLNYWQTITCT